jgi:hypothetical protein
MEQKKTISPLFLTEKECQCIGTDDKNWEKLEFGFTFTKVTKYRKYSGSTIFDCCDANYNAFGQSRYVPLSCGIQIISKPSLLHVKKYRDGNGFFPDWVCHKLTVKTESVGEEYFKSMMEMKIIDTTYVTVIHNKEDKIFIFEVKQEYQSKGIMHVEFFPHNFGISINFLLKK